MAIKAQPSTAAKAPSPHTGQLSPRVARALTRLDEDTQAARQSGLWSPAYQRMADELARMFVEANEVDSVLDICFQAMCNRVAEQHNLRLVRAREDASGQLDGEIIVFREAGIVILPHGMSPLAALDQLRAAVDEGSR
ncbi:hypothetical protein ACIQPS_09080 [Streptomyces sp. NPDC091290]|uniref:hypothetical protein n=1 Tax=Streptomyces sp. NPDC091290 TaxID=3365990 RepID=UPI0037FA5212